VFGFRALQQFAQESVQGSSNPVSSNAVKTTHDGQLVCMTDQLIYTFNILYASWRALGGRAINTAALVLQVPDGVCFLACDSMLTALYAIANPVVLPFVTRVDQSKRLKLGSCNFHHTVAPSL